MGQSPFQGVFVVHRLGVAMINPHTKFKVSMFTHYKDIKVNAKCRNSGELRVTQSPAMSAFNRAHKTSYATLTETMHASCTIFELQQVICQKSPILTYPTCIWCLHWSDPIQISQRSLASEN